MFKIMEFYEKKLERNQKNITIIKNYYIFWACVYIKMNSPFCNNFFIF